MKLSYPEYMPNKYSLPKDLQDRLSGTVCRYDGVPVQISYEGGTKLDLYDFKSKPIKKINWDDEKLDISMIEVGYVNYEGAGGAFVTYMIRNPKKKYKAALDPRYIEYREIDGKPADFSIPEGFFSRSFERALTGDYPSYQEVIENLGEGGEQAVSPEIAFRKDSMGLTYMYYKMKPVGWSAPFSTKFTLIDSDLGWVVDRHLSRVGLTIW